jgi:hypothetical protein
MINIFLFKLINNQNYYSEQSQLSFPIFISSTDILSFDSLDELQRYVDDKKKDTHHYPYAIFFSNVGNAKHDIIEFFKYDVMDIDEFPQICSKDVSIDLILKVKK